MTTPTLQSYPIEPARAKSSVALDLLLTLVTCGVYNLFWQARQFRALNAFLGVKRFRFWSWLFLTLLTCGGYHVYTEYVIGQSITQIQRSLGRAVSTNLPLVCLVVSILGLTPAADAIQQHEINAFFEP